MLPTNTEGCALVDMCTYADTVGQIKVTQVSGGTQGLFSIALGSIFYRK